MTVQLNNISKHFSGGKPLFENLSLQITVNTRMGLIGRNGAGKSTLLKLIMKQIEPDEGEVFRTNGIQVNYLSQEPSITPGLTLEEELRSVFSEVNALKAEEEALLKGWENPDLDTDGAIALSENLERVQMALERLDADQMEAKIGKILKGLGFTPEEYSRQSSDFSGGWQMRINLAKVLLQGAEILLLDEPTNHLDMEACEWLEDFLKNYPGGLVLVSHDRHFLDEVCTEIAELENRQIMTWVGNYTSFLEQKEMFIEQQLAAQQRQTKTLAKQEEFVARFKASASRGTQAKSREKQLQKIERIEVLQEDKRRMKLSFPMKQTSGREVLTLKNIAKAYGDNVLFTELNAEMERGQRVFLLGANGAGKTTLFRLMVGEEHATAGTVEQGYNVQMGYFAQNQLDTLNPEKNALETMQEACPGKDNTELRTVLGQFLLTGDNSLKKIGVLSGGEKSKVALAKMMMQGNNLLLLDEPTNHMDIPAKDAMTDALKAYEGTMLCISHDRALINSLATHIWELYEGQLICYEGNYAFYRKKRDERRAKALQEAAKRQPKASEPELHADKPKATETKSTELTQRKVVEKQLRSAEKEIVTLEQAIASLQAKLENPSLQQNYTELAKVTQELEAKQAQLEQLNATWSQLAETLA